MGYLQRSDEAPLALGLGSYLCGAPNRAMPSLGLFCRNRRLEISLGEARKKAA
jgi:hypothetical protein